MKNVNAPEDVVRSDQRMAGQVKRYHTWPTITTQNIAEHSWDVMRIIYAIWDPIGITPIPGDVQRHVHAHDCGELRCGDSPYPIKRNNPDLKEIMDRLEGQSLKDQGVYVPLIPDEWKVRVKIAHTIEMMEFALHELLLGNQYGSYVATRMQVFLREQLAAAPRETVPVRMYLDGREKRYEAILQEVANVPELFGGKSGDLS